MTDTKKGNLDLLRVVLMCMVITLHYLHVQDLLPVSGAPSETVRYVCMLPETFAIVAVNVWVLMSGYLRVNGSFKTGRFLELLFTVFFYGAGIYLIAYITGFAQNDAGMFGWIQAFLPVSGNAYWFMTAYLILYLLSPVLNAGIKALPKEQLRFVLMLLLVWSSLIKSIVLVYFPADDMGYGLQWFICLYLCGAYLRLYGEEKEENKGGQALLVYIVSQLAVYALAVACYILHERTGRFAHYAGVPFHYNFILNFIGAVAFFKWFLSMREVAGAVKKTAAFLAPHTLGVYLLHAHPVWFENWTLFTERITGALSRANTGLVLLLLVLTVLIVFVCGTLVDVLRGYLFDVVKNLFSEQKAKT